MGNPRGGDSFFGKFPTPGTIFAEKSPPGQMSIFCKLMLNLFQKHFSSIYSDLILHFSPAPLLFMQLKHLTCENTVSYFCKIPIPHPRGFPPTPGTVLTNYPGGGGCGLELKVA